MKIVLSSDSIKYASIIFDVIRVFLPHLNWQEFIGESGEAQQVLDIKVGKDVVIVGFDQGRSIKETFTTSVENEIKRTIKLAVYRFFNEILTYPASPWGILTGIRPTKIVHRYWDQGFTGKDIKELLQEKFRLAPDKSQKLIDITQLQRKYLLDPGEARKSVSIYLSIPFCPTRCSYCSFPAFSAGQGSEQIDDYLRYLLQEIQEVGKALKQAKVSIQTIYVGGGTPTTLNLQQLTLLLNGIKENLLTEHTIEYTFEAGRPDTIDEAKLLLLKNYNITRISINPQTMWENTLHKIGRFHSPQDIIEKFILARKIGFAAINMDLIIGLPGEGLEQIKYSLEEIEKLKPENLTLHALAIKRTAQLRAEPEENILENQAPEMFDYAEQWCAVNGYVPYYLYRQKQILGNQENVGYTLDEKPCIYNIQMIEERQTIWGLGVGAGSKIVNFEDWTLVNSYNPKDLFIYKQRIKEIIKAKVDKILTLG